ncbi:MAG: XRE family transcriptional regulator [Variovorax sp.]|nr:MAG: XRE family transcriptional regulator [Variovorax sp.]
MSKHSTSLDALPVAAHAALARAGQRLRAHRLQRGWTSADMAARLLCSPTTWRALEAGKPGTSVGLLAHALWLFGEIDSLDGVAPAPAGLAANRRVRRKAGGTAPGAIQEDERDF